MSVQSQAIRIPEHLPPIERRILAWLAGGHPLKAITFTALGRKGLSIKTVEAYRASLQKRVGLYDLASLTKLALRIGLTTIDV